MKSKVVYSAFSIILTLILTGAMIACTIIFKNELPALIVFIAVLAFMIVPALFFAPVAITADSSIITVKSPLKNHTIQMRRVVSVERFMPTMGAIRLFASGGYFGYWGIFTEGDIGRYMAYFGKASDCFLLRLDNGDKYVLGCADPDAMVAYIRSQLKS